MEVKETDTGRPFIKLSTIVPAAVIGAFQHQLYIEGVTPITAEVTDKAILRLLKAYGEGRVAIVPEKSERKGKSAMVNDYLRSHV